MKKTNSASCYLAALEEIACVHLKSSKRGGKVSH